MDELREVWTIKIYRRDSETPVVYEDVKHFWWEDWRLVVSQYRSADGPEHDYWIWPRDLISHVKVGKSTEKAGQ